MRLAQPIETKQWSWLRGVDLNHRPLGYEPNGTRLTASDFMSLAGLEYPETPPSPSSFGPKLDSRGQAFQISKFRFAGRVASTVFPACIPMRCGRCGARNVRMYTLHCDLFRDRDFKSSARFSVALSSLVFAMSCASYRVANRALSCPPAPVERTQFGTNDPSGPPAWEAGVNPSANGESATYSTHSGAERGTVALN